MGFWNLHKRFYTTKLEGEVRKLAERIACVPNELLMLNKAALNKVAEEMGLRNYFEAAFALDVISHLKPFPAIAANLSRANAYYWLRIIELSLRK